ncbi:o-succinylbenzoate synthase [Streptomyces sp. NPDC008343]|uniref:o-succinylbenzoate synthase n=1 Tax=Streptomyces sp. NPDC008343 TaxID=3364828 RepID=UPI0036E6D9A1
MKIAEVELRRVRLPLKAPFRTSFGSQSERDILLIQVTSDDGTRGWGECVALSAPLYSSEYVDGAHRVTRDFLLPRLWMLPDVTAYGLEAALTPISGHRMAKAGLEMAVLDAELRTRGTSLGEHLGAVKARVPSGVSVGIAESIPALLDVVAGHLDEGYSRIKLKIEPGWDIEPVSAVRERFGDILLQVDANAAYTMADATLLAKLDAFDLLLLEQPLPEEDIRGHAALATQLQTPICLDESITSARAAADAIAIGACKVVNIKSGRVGGLLEARRVHDVCAAHGVPVWCGGMLETGIGRAANMALAALPNFLLPGDTSASDRFWRRDLVTQPFVLRDGHVDVPTGPGLGVEMDEAWLDEVTVSKECHAAESL